MCRWLQIDWHISQLDQIGSSLEQYNYRHSQTRCHFFERPNARPSPHRTIATQAFAAHPEWQTVLLSASLALLLTLLSPMMSSQAQPTPPPLCQTVGLVVSHSLRGPVSRGGGLRRMRRWGMVVVERLCHHQFRVRCSSRTRARRRHFLCYL